MNSLYKRQATPTHSQPRSRGSRGGSARPLRAVFAPEVVAPAPRARSPPRSPHQQQQQQHYADVEHAQSHELGWRTDFKSSYVAGRLVGAGSFGQVHHGIDLHSGSAVAIKSLPKVRGKLTREKTLEKIRRETDMLSRLQRVPGVIRLLDLFEDASSVHVVTEFCGGGDLQKYVEARGPLDEPLLALMAWEILKIVKACHQLGVLHGDIKPANFCLVEAKPSFAQASSSSSHLRAIDFGCSQFIGPRRLSKRTGTPVFMAPEIFERNYSDKVDTWAVGVTMYWLYCQRFPFFDSVTHMQQAALADVALAVGGNEIDLQSGPWQYMSPLGISFVKGCLTRSEDERLSVAQALLHPWFAQHISKEERASVTAATSVPAAA